VARGFTFLAEYGVMMSLRAQPERLTGVCPHGERVRRFGKSQAGKFWAALMCPARECAPEWVNIADVLMQWTGAKIDGGLGRRQEPREPQREPQPGEVFIPADDDIPPF
jgi:hypothetical protein